MDIPFFKGFFGDKGIEITPESMPLTLCVSM